MQWEPRMVDSTVYICVQTYAFRYTYTRVGLRTMGPGDNVSATDVTINVSMKKAGRKGQRTGRVCSLYTDAHLIYTIHTMAARMEIGTMKPKAAVMIWLR